MKEIAARYPVDRTARLVTSKGTEYNFENITRGDQILDIAPIAPMPYDVTNLTGKRSGRLTVVRYYGPKGNDNSHRWVVRCDCGIFTIRRGKQIANKSNEDCCDRCQHLYQKKREQTFRTTGKWPIIRSS